MKKIKFLFLGLLTGLVLSVCAGCGQTAGDVKSTEDTDPVENAGNADTISWQDLAPIDALDLKYADQFSVTYYGEEKYALVTIGEDEKFLVVPEEEQGAGRYSGRHYASSQTIK